MDEDELLAELDELEAECEMEGLCDMGAIPICAPVAQACAAAAPAEQMSATDDETRELEKMMDISYPPAPAQPSKPKKSNEIFNSSANRSSMAIQEALAKDSASKSAALRPS